jgi:hypothetical protein
MESASPLIVVSCGQSGDNRSQLHGRLFTRIDPSVSYVPDRPIW